MLTYCRGISTSTVVVVGATLLRQTVIVRGDCAFRFAGYPNINKLPTWKIPAAGLYSPGVWVLNDAHGTVYLAHDGTEEAVICIADSWSYQTADGAWKTNVTFPDEDSTPMSFESLFTSSRDGDVVVSPIPASTAPAVSDSLYGREIKLNLTCNHEVAIEEGESCVLFKVDFTNYSPDPDMDMVKYRFASPAIPGFELPAAVPWSPGDIRLNDGNPIVEPDGTRIVGFACNGDQAEYLGEDEKWYYWFTGIDSQMYNLSHIFYASDTDDVNIATIQENWGSNLEAALYNRIVRLLIHCNNEVNFEEGYLLFTVGDFDFSRTCANYPDICAGSAFGDISQATADNFCRTWMCMAFVLVAVGMASVLVY